MINENLKTIINDLIYAENEKDLKIKMFKNLKDLLINNDLIFQEHEKISEAFKIVAKFIDEN